MTTPPVPAHPSLNSKKLILLSFIFIFPVLLVLFHLNYSDNQAAILLHFQFLRDNLMRCLSQSIISLYHQKIIYHFLS